MPRFDLDDQRAIVCLFGLFGLMGEALAFYVTGRVLPDMLTGIFATMAIGPVGESWVRHYRGSKGKDDPPPPPLPPKDSDEERGDEERFHDKWGYFEMRPA
jgi:hypothetical protein